MSRKRFRKLIKARKESPLTWLRYLTEQIPIGGLSLAEYSFTLDTGKRRAASSGGCSLRFSSGIPHPSFLCRVKRALPFLLPQHRRTTREMDRENGSTEREREENQISDLRPVAFSFVANWSNNVDPEPTPDPFIFLSLCSCSLRSNFLLSYLFCGSIWRMTWSCFFYSSGSFSKSRMRASEIICSKITKGIGSVSNSIGAFSSQVFRTYHPTCPIVHKPSILDRYNIVIDPVKSPQLRSLKDASDPFTWFSLGVNKRQGVSAVLSFRFMLSSNDC